MLINRRKLLVGLGSLIAAPAVVRAASLMPVRRPPMWGPIILGTRRALFDDLREMDDLIVNEAFFGLPIFQGYVGEFRGIIIREMS